MAYIINYATKKQARTHSASAILAKILERDNASPPEAKKGASALLVRLANSMNSRQEVGAPMVVATLMGWAPCIASQDRKNVV